MYVPIKDIQEEEEVFRPIIGPNNIHEESDDNGNRILKLFKSVHT
jgi:hypothetical protein